MTRSSPVERVRLVPRDHRALRHWGDRDLSQLSDQVAANVIGAGQCLPAVWVDGAVVVSVVRWDATVLPERLESGMGAVLQRVIIGDRVEQGVDPEPAPLEVVGSLVLSRLGSSWTAMAGSSLFGPVVTCVPRRPRSWTLTECDAMGYTIVHANQHGTSVLVQGHIGPRPGTRPSPIVRRLWLEQLFDAALRAGVARPPATHRV